MKLLSMLIAALIFIQSACYASIGFPFPGPGRLGVSGSSACTSGQIVGWSTAAATEQGIQVNQVALIKRSISCTSGSGTFNAWLKNSSTANNSYFYAYIVSDSNGTPGTILWVSSLQTIPSNDTSVSKRSISFTGISIVPGTYWIGVQGVTNAYTMWTYTTESEIVGDVAVVTQPSLNTMSDLSSLSFVKTSTSGRAFNIEF